VSGEHADLRARVGGLALQGKKKKKKEKRKGRKEQVAKKKEYHAKGRKRKYDKWSLPGRSY